MLKSKSKFGKEYNFKNFVFVFENWIRIQMFIQKIKSQRTRDQMSTKNTTIFLVC